METAIKGCLLGVFGLFFALLVGLFFYNTSHYRYCITVPDGRNATSYYTNAYRQRGGCVYFISSLSQDTSQACGTFSIQRLRK